MEPLVWLTVLVVVTKLVSSLSTTAATEYLWSAYMWVVPSPRMQTLREKRQRLVEVRAQRANTSSKDEFAKWARLDREHHTLKAEIEGITAQVSQSRLALQAVVRVVRWLCTTGVKLYVQWHYRKVPVFWIPPHSLPGAVEYFFALPSAPHGSVSVASWLVITSTSYDFLLRCVKTLWSTKVLQVR